jgi:hypothetical protein
LVPDVIIIIERDALPTVASTGTYTAGIKCSIFKGLASHITSNDITQFLNYSLTVLTSIFSTEL